MADKRPHPGSNFQSPESGPSSPVTPGSCASLPSIPGSPSFRLPDVKRARLDTTLCGHVYPKLPILEKKDEMLTALDKSNVICVVGDTGCGKSTQLPQYLCDHFENAKILVTQPRRVAATNLAKRVASERGWTLGQEVGYRIGGSTKDSRDSKICFATTGYLLQMLVNHPMHLNHYTHLVLDEMHERSMEMDLLCVIVRMISVSDSDSLNPKRRTKLVVMSATLQAELFQKYFTKLNDNIEVPLIQAGDKRFGVDVKYLNDVFPDQQHVSKMVEQKFP